jgi:hypothetical protein
MSPRVKSRHQTANDRCPQRTFVDQAAPTASGVSLTGFAITGVASAPAPAPPGAAVGCIGTVTAFTDKKWIRKRQGAPARALERPRRKAAPDQRARRAASRARLTVVKLIIADRVHAARRVVEPIHYGRHQRMSPTMPSLLIVMRIYPA